MNDPDSSEHSDRSDDDLLKLPQAWLQRQIMERKAMCFPCLPAELSSRDAETLSKNLRAYFLQARYGEGVDRCVPYISGQNVYIIRVNSTRALQIKDLAAVMPIVQKFFMQLGKIKDAAFTSPEPPADFPQLPEDFNFTSENVRRLVLAYMTERRERLAGLFGGEGILPAAREESRRRMEAAYAKMRAEQERIFLGYASQLSDAVRNALTPHWGTILGRWRRQGEVAELHAERRFCTQLDLALGARATTNSVKFFVDEKNVLFTLSGKKIVIETADMHSEHIAKGDRLLSAQLEELLPGLHFAFGPRRCTISIDPQMPVRLSIASQEAARVSCDVVWADE